MCENKKADMSHFSNLVVSIYHDWYKPIKPKDNSSWVSSLPPLDHNFIWLTGIIFSNRHCIKSI